MFRNLLYNILKKVALNLKISYNFFPRAIKFLVVNKSFWNDLNTVNSPNGYILVEVNNNIYMAIGTSVLANLIAKTKGLKILYIAHKSVQVHGIFKDVRNSFSNSDYWILEDFISHKKNELNEIFSKEKLKISTIDDIYNFKYSGIHVGDLIYDQILRVGEWKATVNKIDSFVLSELQKAIYIIESLKYLKSKYNIRKTSFSHNVGYGGIIMRFFAQNGIESYIGIIGSGPIRKFKKMEYNRNPWTADASFEYFQKLISNKKQKNIIKLSKDYINKRFNGELNYLDAKKAFDKKSRFYNDKKLFNKKNQLDVNKKNIFIMLHAFTDYPNIYNTLYKDYFKWYEDTLENILEIDNVNWIIKEHPTAEFYPTNDINIKNYTLSKINEKSNIIFLSSSSSFNTKSLIYIADTILTVGGTASLEFSTFGIPSIICSRNYFSEFGFAYVMKSKKEYHKMLKNIEFLKTLNEEQKNIASIIYFITFGILCNNDNNDGYLPISNHEERLKEDYRTIYDYYLNYIKSKKCKDFNKKIIEFINSDDEVCFFKNEYFKLN